MIRNKKEFIKERKTSKNDIEQVYQLKLLDLELHVSISADPYLKMLIESGYNFDSSKIQFKISTYGSISTKEFTKMSQTFLKIKIIFLNLKYQHKIF